MWKSLLVGVSALAVAGGTLALAQDGARGPHDMDRGGGFAAHRQLSPEDMRAFTDARIAALKAGLELTADQEKNWPPFEKALRDMAKARADRMQALQNAPAAADTDPIARLQRRADAVSQHGALLKQLAAAAGPLYQSLDDGQKNRFQILARFERREHMRHALERMREHWRDRGDGERGGWRDHGGWRDRGDGDRGGSR